MTWQKLNKEGQGSYDPWPEISPQMGFDETRHVVVADEVERWAAIHPAPVIADFGCGDGRGLAHLYERGFRKLIGIDHSSEGLKRTQLRTPSAHVIQIDLLTSWFFPCDVAICCEVLEHLPHHEDVYDVLKMIVKSVSPGGLVIISVPDDSICEIDSDHRRLFTPKDPTRLLTAVGLQDVQNISYFYSNEYPWPWMTAKGVKSEKV